MEYIYASLLLHKLGKEINETNLKRVIEAAGGTPDEAKIKTLIASLKGIDIEAALREAEKAEAPAAKPEAKPEKKPEEKKEETTEGLAALFG